VSLSGALFNERDDRDAERDAPQPRCRICRHRYHLAPCEVCIELGEFCLLGIREDANQKEVRYRKHLLTK
jgi:hypothetical protein